MPPCAVRYHRSDSFFPDYLVRGTLEFGLNFLTFQAVEANKLDALASCPLRAKEKTAKKTKSGPALLPCRSICLEASDTGLYPNNRQSCPRPRNGETGL